MLVVLHIYFPDFFLSSSSVPHQRPVCAAESEDGFVALHAQWK